MFLECFILDENIRVNHNVIMEDRKKLTLTGIKNVVNFDDETIILDTHCGKFVIKGSGLHILNFNTETGDLSAEGRIHALIYTAEEKNSNFFGKLFR